MFYRIVYILAFSLLAPCIADSAAFPEDGQAELVVNNRILAKVREKTISVLDVMKKMDVFLVRYYPQHASSKVARYQFYSSNWRDTLNQMIDEELMIADAESREIKVTDGEVREEVQQRFGPNVMAALATLNLSYDEAWRMVQEDMIVQRMNWFRVTAKALQKVTSQDVKEAYRNYCAANPAKDEWKYQVLTVRASSEDAVKATAEKLSAIMRAQFTTLENIATLVKQQLPENDATTVTVSAELSGDDKSLTEAHRAVLSTLGTGEHSPWVSQISRDGSPVMRMFLVKDHHKVVPPKFEDVAANIKDQLLQQAALQEKTAYSTKLHQRLGFDDESLDIPDGFHPFEMRTHGPL